MTRSLATTHRYEQTEDGLLHPVGDVNDCNIGTSKELSDYRFDYWFARKIEALLDGPAKERYALAVDGCGGCLFDLTGLVFSKNSRIDVIGEESVIGKPEALAITGEIPQGNCHWLLVLYNLCHAGEWDGTIEMLATSRTKAYMAYANSRTPLNARAIMTNIAASNELPGEKGLVEAFRGKTKSRVEWTVSLSTVASEGTTDNVKPDAYTFDTLEKAERFIAILRDRKKREYEEKPEIHWQSAYYTSWCEPKYAGSLVCTLPNRMELHADIDARIVQDSKYTVALKYNGASTAKYKVLYSTSFSTKESAKSEAASVKSLVKKGAEEALAALSDDKATLSLDESEDKACYEIKDGSGQMISKWVINIVEIPDISVIQ